MTKIIVRVNRGRAFLWTALLIVCGAPALLVVPPPAGVIVFIALASAVWFGNVTFLAGYLIKKEIGDHLKDDKHSL